MALPSGPGAALASHQEISAFLAEVERRAFKQAMFAVRDEHSALDVVQDAMLKLTEKYSDKPAAELPMLFQRILQNTIHDHFRRQKVRIDVDDAAVRTGERRRKGRRLRSARNSFRRNRTRMRTPIPRAAGSNRVRSCPIIEQALDAAAGASTGSLSAALLGRTGCGGDRRRDGLLGRQRQDPLLACGSCAGRDAQGQRGDAMTTKDRRFRQENNHLPRSRHGQAQGRDRLSPAARAAGGPRAACRSAARRRAAAGRRARVRAGQEPSVAGAASGRAGGSGSGSR